MVIEADISLKFLYLTLATGNSYDDEFVTLDLHCVDKDTGNTLRVHDDTGRDKFITMHRRMPFFRSWSPISRSRPSNHFTDMGIVSW